MERMVKRQEAERRAVNLLGELFPFASMTPELYSKAAIVIQRAFIEGMEAAAEIATEAKIPADQMDVSTDPKNHAFDKGYNMACFNLAKGFREMAAEVGREESKVAK